ncbi:MAG TPA: peptidase M28, partial [Erythrobacter sp.]|nr:peptidase M28 [Erythrobacter sp.]
MKRFVLAACSALLLTACDGALETGAGADAMLDLPEVADGTLSEATMKRVTERLSSDEFEGRAPGTQGEEKTVAYLIEEFEKAGLEPGNNGSWVQEVPLVEITGKDYAPLTIAGADSGPIELEYASDWVGVSYREDVETALEDSELVFVGYGINAPEKGWNDYAGLDMAGKTAVILVNDPDFGAETLEGPFNGKAMTYYGRWTYKYEEAGRQGAAGALIIHDTEPASYGWNVVESSWSGPQAYASRGDNPPPMTQLNGWVQKSVAERLFAAAGKDFGELAAAAREEGFAPVALGLTASTSFR